MRLRIGSGFGIPIYLHWTFLLLPVWILLSRPDDVTMPLPVVFTVVMLGFACIVLHEFGHILMARYFGIGTEDVTLYPIGGVARLKAMTEKPLEELLIALAGPAVNVAISLLLFVVLLPIGIYDHQLLFNTFPGQVGLYLLLTNVILVFFNMIPAFPMDGGRVFRAVLSLWLGHVQGTRIAVYVGTGMAILLGIFGIVNGSLLPVIAIFIIFVGQQELLALRLREQRRQREESGELLEALPVRPREDVAPEFPFLLQPRISVYTWDNQTGTWRSEPSAPS